jgi:hypothetical protein
MSRRRDQHGRRAPEEPVIEWQYVTRIVPGEYHAYSRHSAIYFDRQFRRHVCAIHFDILDEFTLERLASCTWYLNLGSKDKPRSGRRSNYWIAWVKANGGPPARSDRLSPKVFEGRYATVRIEDTAKTFRQATVEDGMAYSIVRDVISWKTGSTNHSNHTSRKAPNKQRRVKKFPRSFVSRDEGV